MTGLSIAQQKQEIFTRNDTAEIQLRKIVKNTLQTILGKQKAKEAVLNSMNHAVDLNYSLSDRDVIRAEKMTYEQLFDSSVNKIYLPVLCLIITDNYLFFQNIFEGITEEEANKHFQIINQARRCPSHAYPDNAENWSDNDFYEYRNTMAWLEPILKQYD